MPDCDVFYVADPVSFIYTDVPAFLAQTRSVHRRTSGEARLRK
jgi:hypothetical protein